MADQLNPMATKIDGQSPLPAQMQATLETFAAAGQRIEGFYRQLNDEVHRLNAQLETRNRELRRNLAEREKMQAILISALQSLTTGVLAVGQDGIVIVANPAACELLERPVDQLATRHIDDVLEPVEGCERLLHTLRGANGVQHRLEWTRTDAHGQEQHLELVAARTPEPYDEHLAGIVVVEDQTQLRRLERQANLRNRLSGMGELAMNLAHEIRNPLGSIALFATALERELEANPALAPLAGQIVQGVKSLEHLVANTLEFAKPRRIAMTRVDLIEVIRDSLVYVEHPLEQNEIGVAMNIEIESDDPRAEIAGDAEQLRQVFLNLFLNAVQAMGAGGTLGITIDADGESGWLIDIEDDGAGIPEDVVDRIFNPFFTTRPKGSGIGLSVVHSIVTAHQAEIEVESRPGEGTRFRLRFPSEPVFTGTEV